MEIIGAAALIAVGIVLAAIIYGRMHGARTVAVATPTPIATPIASATATGRRGGTGESRAPRRRIARTHRRGHAPRGGAR